MERSEDFDHRFLQPTRQFSTAIDRNRAPISIPRTLLYDLPRRHAVLTGKVLDEFQDRFAVRTSRCIAREKSFQGA